MIIAVGSSNPVKQEAVKRACKGRMRNVKIVGVDAASGVPSQPMSDVQTQRGAKNRALAALHAVSDAEIGIGLEGGVQKTARGLMNSVWACVADRKKRVWCANGERFLLPAIIANPILAGQEMGPVLDAIAQEKDIRKGRGMIGVVTKGFVTRSEAYGNLVLLALGLWKGNGWEKEVGK